ncbi:MAG: hypothetical protein FWD58_01455 [Firmicutes bacterium]|nr:hypothetical protein [Bacillota bacterium]
MPTLLVTKAVSSPIATTGGRLYYEIAIENPTEYYATKMLLTDAFDEKLAELQYTTDGGKTWLDWAGVLAVDDMAPGEARAVVITGVVTAPAGDAVSNKASVSVVFCSIRDSGFGVRDS